MEKHTLKIYDTEATIYEIPFMELQEGLVKVEGLPKERESILFDREYIPVKERKFSSFVGFGASPKINSYVLAKNIDQKQLANLLIAIGMVDGVAYEIDTDLVTITEHKPEVEEAPKKKRRK